MCSWRNWPLKDEPIWKSLLLAFSVTGASLLVGTTLADPLTGIVSFLLLALSVAPYWLPGRYTVDENGVCIDRLWSQKRRRWSCYRRAAFDKNGVFLGISSRQSPLDSFRGDYLRCPGKVAEIYEFAKKHIV